MESRRLAHNILPSSSLFFYNSISVYFFGVWVLNFCLKNELAPSFSTRTVIYVSTKQTRLLKFSTMHVAYVMRKVVVMFVGASYHIK